MEGLIFRILWYFFTVRTEGTVDNLPFCQSPCHQLAISELNRELRQVSNLNLLIH